MNVSKTHNLVSCMGLSNLPAPLYTFLQKTFTCLQHSSSPTASPTSSDLFKLKRSSHWTSLHLRFLRRSVSSLFLSVFGKCFPISTLESLTVQGSRGHSALERVQLTFSPFVDSMNSMLCTAKFLLLHTSDKSCLNQPGAQDFVPRSNLHILSLLLWETFFHILFWLFNAPKPIAKHHHLKETREHNPSQFSLLLMEGLVQS